MARMIRKQFYIESQQEALLKRLVPLIKFKAIPRGPLGGTPSKARVSP